MFMKKGQNAVSKVPVSNLKVVKTPPGWISIHEHIHASNCGHKSYVHGDHIDYEHDGHYHYVINGKTYDCPGPNAKILPFNKPQQQGNKGKK
jgi:hypothetical protein